MECIQLLQAHEYYVEHSVGVAIYLTPVSCDPRCCTVADHTTTNRSHRTLPEAGWSKNGQSPQ